MAFDRTHEKVSITENTIQERTKEKTKKQKQEKQENRKFGLGGMTNIPINGRTWKTCLIKK